MDFAAAMRFVEGDHGFPSRPEDRHARRLAWLLERSGLGGPWRALPRVVVAGSCGKASTARFLAFIVRALLDGTGSRAPVGLGTKPPLRETPDGHRERYQRLDPGAARWIAREDFARFASELAGHLEALRREAPALGEPAAYELRAWILARSCVDMDAALGVVEANIGLRDDAAGALGPPAVQVLTPVGDDHGAILLPPSDSPPWLSALGARAGPVWHKAGGLFAGVPVVVGAQVPAVLAAIEGLARSRGAGPLHVFGRDFGVRDVRCSLAGSTAVVDLGDAAIQVNLGALGRFQVDNAAVAAKTAMVLQQAGVLPGDGAALRAAVVEGLRRADTPGRMQRVGTLPTTLVTVGATRIKAEGTVATLRELIGQGHVVLCLTEMARVEGARGAVEILGDISRLRAVVATRVERDGENADVDPAVLGAWLRESHPALEVYEDDDPAAAVARARSLAQPDGDVVLLLGNGLAAYVSSRVSS